MQIGKLEWKDLKNIINNNRGVKREDVRIRSGIGEDCSVINFGEYECVVSTDPITGADKNIGKLAVHINCNDIASCGVEPLGILVTILAPPNTKLEEIENIMNEINYETKKLNIEILGGHTEITDAVNKMIVSCTVMGKTKQGKSVSTAGAKIGDDIVVTKYLCLEGSSIIVNDYYEKAREVLTDDEIKEAKNYVNHISVIKEGKIAGDFGVNSMHDITEGGLLGALWEVAEGSNVGFKVYKKQLPITNVTKKLCNFFKIDPLKFISSGSMVITCKNGEKLVRELQENNIPAIIVGRITKEGKKLVENNNDNIDVLPVERDELFKII
ncbi:AIR synthase family protein [Clostridium botulinum]|uniref:AIR synthase n=1 Tax=Clostridium botulinum TaxID=1491 RepID=A0A9Q1ZBA4_CLOBO|nr:AIR synthase family protein [Clostridium botulinum]KEH99204.1 AIR synthase [Clostridium botulinum C/D str. Sp77]KEI02586.1 AIR synthase [Clostridium botulinum D str. 16868]KLU76684.1 AIR synthase [Clostridium botulinum V891]KOA72597.1 AIR synthase [Clostridium botulinum]KOA76904.1 AIR synthase [Clostridium botulinum]